MLRATNHKSFFALAAVSIAVVACSAIGIHAAISINEFSSGSNPEWIELYNNSSTEVDLTNWYFTDALGHKEVFSTTILGNNYFLYKKNVDSGGWLNNNGDTIYLYDNATPSATLVDAVTYGPGKPVGSPASDKSAGRVPDGSGNWVNNLAWSQASPNPTPAPTNTPSPTNTPTPEPSATPTNIPTSAPKPTAPPKPTPTQIVELIPSIGEREFVNARQDPTTGKLIDLGEESNAPPTSEQVLGTTTSGSKLIPVILIVLGVGGLVTSLVLLFRHARRADILAEDA